MVTKIKLLELMSSRMFHDLAGPIGAVSNSIEFLEEDNPNIKEKALSIIKSSACESIARLKFFRQAYGTVGEREVYLVNLREVVDEFVSSSKIKVKWTIEDRPINCYVAKSVLNLIIIAMGCLIHGGVVEIEQLEKDVKLSLQGNNCGFNDNTKYLLSGDIANITLTSANIQIYYTNIMIEEARSELRINKKDEELEFLIFSSNRG